MVLYNEFNPDEEAIGACSHADLKRGPDAVIVVGTSLKVPGIRRLAKEFCSVTRGRRGGFTAWINHDPEPLGVDFKDAWDMVVRGECDDVARLVGLPKWDDKDCGEYVMMEGQALGKSSRPEVVLDLKPIAAVQSQGYLTPTDSPRAQSLDPSDGPAKLKQPPLSFAPKPTSELAVKKKLGRKPLPSKPTKTTNKITNAFSTTKSSKEMAGKPTESDGSSSFQHNALFPGLAKEVVMPTDTPDASQASSFNGSHTPRPSHVAVEIPYNRQETISPKGRIPSGMANLLS